MNDSSAMQWKCETCEKRLCTVLLSNSHAYLHFCPTTVILDQTKVVSAIKLYAKKLLYLMKEGVLLIIY